MPEPRLAEALQGLLAEDGIAWSIGRHGAIAEFSRDPGEPAAIAPSSVITARGALAVQAPPWARLIAWETPASRRNEWLQRVALCAPSGRAGAGSGEPGATVSDLGPDTGALRPEDREACLFDLGVGGPNVRVGVRTADPAQLARLRAGVGRGLFENDELIHALVRDSPHRVFLSTLGRLEVYQAIAPEGGTAPEGPHTHLLPALLAEPDRSPEGLPEGWVACVVGYPANPLRDAKGRRQAFALAAHDRFQTILAEFGDPRHVGVKNAVRDAVRSGAEPVDFPVHDHQRPAAIVALRQLACTDGDSPALQRWRAAFDLNPVD